MATTLGALTIKSSADALTLVAPNASGGTGPYTYQWYKSTTTGFTPGGGNIIAGATSQTLVDTALLPGTTYFYVCEAKDSGDVVGDSAQIAVQWQGRSIKPSTQIDVNQSGDPTGASVYGFGRPGRYTGGG